MYGNVRERPDEISAIMRIVGADAPEDVGQHTIDQIGAYLLHPLHINWAARSSLAASGMFTPYQVASLIDYRTKNGDILSFSELAAIDGFNREIADALKYFVSLDSRKPAGKSSACRGNVYNMLTYRSSVKYSGYLSEDSGVNSGYDYSYGMKYRLSIDDRMEFAVAASRGYGLKDAVPGAGTFYLAYYGRRNPGKIVIGDYNLRYGQGLAVWSGFNMGGVSYPQSFFRRPSGISPYLSFSGTGGFRGIAADFIAGNFTVSASMGVGGLKEIMSGRKNADISFEPAVNVGWTGRRAQASFTLCGSSAPLAGAGDAFAEAAASADFRCNLKGVDVFGEAAIDLVDMQFSAIVGTAFKCCGQLEAAFSGRYSEDGFGLSSGGRINAGQRVGLAGAEGTGSSVSRHTGTFCLDGLYSPNSGSGGKPGGWEAVARLDYGLQIDGFWSLSARFSEKLRPESENDRSELRCDMKWSDGTWMALMRLDALYCEDFGFLSYVEGGYSGDRCSLYVRAGIFRIDSWTDRIYVYERDAPGNFNVPAYYGRGCSASAVFGIKATRRCRLYLRFSTLQYPWVQSSGKEKEGKTDARLQLVLNL